MLPVLPERMVIAVPIALILKSIIDALVDLLYVYLELVHDKLSALVCELHLFVQALEVDVVEVIKE